MAKRVRFEAPGFTRDSATKAASADDAFFWSVLDRYSREEVSAAAQHVLEQAVVPFVAHWINQQAAATSRWRVASLPT